MLSREEIRDECFSVFSQEIIQKYKRELTFYDARNDDRMDRTLLQMCDEYHCKKTIQSNTPTTPEANDWIDVNDRLPEEEENSFIYPNEIVSFLRNKEWKYSTKYEEYSVRNNVTHWQPLPSPPKTTGEKS